MLNATSGIRVNYEIEHLQRIQSSTVKCSFTLIFTRLHNESRVDLDPPYRVGDLEMELKGDSRRTLLSKSKVRSVIRAEQW